MGTAPSRPTGWRNRFEQLVLALEGMDATPYELLERRVARLEARLERAGVSGADETSPSMEEK